MYSHDSISAVFSKFKNAQQANHLELNILLTTFNKNLVDLFMQEGFIRGYKIIFNNQGKIQIKVLLKYFYNKPAINSLTRVSTPGIQTYLKAKDLYKYSSGPRGLYTLILSTDLGLITDTQAKKLKMGGKIIGFIS